MKTSLSDITMSQFIDILCGDTSCLDVPKEQVGEVKMRLIFDFTKLSDPTAATRYLLRRAEMMKAEALLLMYTICHNLVELYAYSEVRSVLARYGERADYSDDDMQMHIDSRIKRCETEIAKLKDAEESEKQQRSSVDIRQSYDRQCASLMAYFKFQIDMGTMKASQFACLIDQASREIKAKQAALSKRR